LEALLASFPTKQFRAESEFKPILEGIQEFRKRLSNERRMPSLKDLDLQIANGVSCNKILAYFLVRLSVACGSDRLSRLFLEEAIIVICMVRRFLNERGYKLFESEIQACLSNSEYCAVKKNPIDVFVVGQGEFFFEFFPCYLSQSLR
jgi:hypothetical protein